VKNQKYEREGRLEVIFYGGNSYTIVLRQMKFGTVNDHGHTYEFYFNCFYLEKKKLLNMAILRSFKVMLGQTLFIIM
jgi:hypothetical protein